MMGDKYDPDERFVLSEQPEDVLRKLLGIELAEEPSEDEGAEGDEPES
jgi:hypothetical protein